MPDACFSAIFGRSPRTIYRVIRAWRASFDRAPRKRSKVARGSRVIGDIVLDDNPDAFLTEMKGSLAEQGYDLSLSTLWRGLNELGISRKKTEIHAKQLRVDLVDFYVQRVRHVYTFMAQLVFLDESGVDSTGTNRHSSRSPAGTRSILAGNYSVINVRFKVVRGSVDAEYFEEWLQDTVLPQTSPYPGPNSILIMDNESFQRFV